MLGSMSICGRWVCYFIFWSLVWCHSERRISVNWGNRSWMDFIRFLHTFRANVKNWFVSHRWKTRRDEWVFFSQVAYLLKNRRNVGPSNRCVRVLGFVNRIFPKNWNHFHWIWRISGHPLARIRHLMTQLIDQPLPNHRANTRHTRNSKSWVSRPHCYARPINTPLINFSTTVTVLMEPIGFSCIVSRNNPRPLNGMFSTSERSANNPRRRTIVLNRSAASLGLGITSKWNDDELRMTLREGESNQRQATRLNFVPYYEDEEDFSFNRHWCLSFHFNWARIFFRKLPIAVNDRFSFLFSP